MKKVHICLGSNSGDRTENLREALKKLSSLPRTELLETSSVYETSPWGYACQRKFLNQVCAIHTALSPEELLKELKRIERQMGRKPGFRYGPRSIDLDILLWGSEVVHTPTLTIPHEKMHQREFVLRPLSELDRNLIHPLLAKSVSELLAILMRSRSDHDAG